MCTRMIWGIRAAAGVVVTAAILAGAAATIDAAQAQTLKAVKERGELVCGVSEGLSGFSAKDAKGEWRGFDVDFCRALAAAIFNDPGKVRFVPLNAEQRFSALQSGNIDILSRNSTWTGPCRCPNRPAKRAREYAASHSTLTAFPPASMQRGRPSGSPQSQGQTRSKSPSGSTSSPGAR